MAAATGMDKYWKILHYFAPGGMHDAALKRSILRLQA
jgi:hypothetical protein